MKQMVVSAAGVNSCLEKRGHLALFSTRSGIGHEVIALSTPINF